MSRPVLRTHTTRSVSQLIAGPPLKPTDPDHTRLLDALLDDPLWNPSLLYPKERPLEHAYRLDMHSTLDRCEPCREMLSRRKMERDLREFDQPALRFCVVSSDEDEEKDKFALEGDEEERRSLPLAQSALITITQRSSLLPVAGASSSASAESESDAFPCAQCRRWIRADTAYWECHNCTALYKADPTDVPRCRLCLVCESEDDRLAESRAVRQMDALESSGKSVEYESQLRAKLVSDLIIPGTLHDRTQMHNLQRINPSQKTTLFKVGSHPLWNEQIRSSDIDASIQLLLRKQQRSDLVKVAKRKMRDEAIAASAVQVCEHMRYKHSSGLTLCRICLTSVVHVSCTVFVQAQADTEVLQATASKLRRVSEERKTADSALDASSAMSDTLASSEQTTAEVTQAVASAQSSLAQSSHAFTERGSGGSTVSRSARGLLTQSGSLFEWRMTIGHGASKDTQRISFAFLLELEKAYSARLAQSNFHMQVIGSQLPYGVEFRITHVPPQGALAGAQWIPDAFAMVHYEGLLWHGVTREMQNTSTILGPDDKARAITAVNACQSQSHWSAFLASPSGGSAFQHPSASMYSHPQSVAYLKCATELDQLRLALVRYNIHRITNSDYGKYVEKADKYISMQDSLEMNLLPLPSHTASTVPVKSLAWYNNTSEQKRKSLIRRWMNWLNSAAKASWAEVYKIVHGGADLPTVVPWRTEAEIKAAPITSSAAAAAGSGGGTPLSLATAQASSSATLLTEAAVPLSLTPLQFDGDLLDFSCPPLSTQTTPASLAAQQRTQHAGASLNPLDAMDPWMRIHITYTGNRGRTVRRWKFVVRRQEPMRWLYQQLHKALPKNNTITDMRFRVDSLLLDEHNKEDLPTWRVAETDQTLIVHTFIPTAAVGSYTPIKLQLARKGQWAD